MSPICATGSVEEPGEIVACHTSYLALIQLGYLPDGQILTPAVSGDGTVMVHGLATNNGSLALMIVDPCDPASAEGAAPVEVSAPDGLPADGPQSWGLTEGSRLACETRDAQEGVLAAPAEIAGEFEGAQLGRAEPVTLTNDPGAVTVLHFGPASEAAPSDGGGE